MRGLWYSAVVVAFAGILCAPPCAADYREETLVPPIGWEKQVSPGFEPPVEYTVVYAGAGLEPSLTIKDCAPKWGPDAVRVLIELYRNPEWAGFQERILSGIVLFSTPEVKTFLEEEYAQELKKTDAKKPAQLMLFLSLMRKIDPDRAKQWVDEGLKDSTGPHFQTFVFDLRERAFQTHNPDVQAQLTRVLNSLPEGELRKALAASIEAMMANQRTEQRTNEPMRVILEKEKGSSR